MDENGSNAGNARDSLDDYHLESCQVVRFRHVRPEDERSISESIRTASRDTLLHRFFSPIRSVSPDLLRSMLVIDRSREVCIVGVIGEGQDQRIVCGARYVRLNEPGIAEIALTVHDDFQHHGLGTFMLKLLARIALADGIRTFEANVMSSNDKMLKLLNKVAPQKVSWHQAGDVYRVLMNVATLWPPE